MYLLYTSNLRSVFRLKSSYSQQFDKSLPLYILIISIGILGSCKKQNEWLDKKATLGDVVPSTLSDYQSLLDNEIMYTNYSAMGLLGADNYYVTYADWQKKTATEKNAYIWASDIYAGETNGDWTFGYKRILYANAVMEGLDKFKKSSSNEEKWKQLKGAAHFYRAYTFFELLHLFAPPYTESSAGGDLGIILKLSADASEIVKRATVKQCYEQVISDLKEAVAMLPENPDYQIRPSKTAALALMAKVYLHKGDYQNALEYSSNALAIKNSILNYNGLPDGQFQIAFPAIGSHPEVIFYAGQMSAYGFIAPANLGFIDSTLYNSYDSNDLRKKLYFLNFNGGIKFKGSYAGLLSYCFSGLATNEVYFINMEALARLNRPTEAIDQLNNLVAKRWKTGSFTPFISGSTTDVLKLIFQEKRKEFPFTGNIRWEDLRRLNKEPDFAITLVRQLNNQTYTLLPNDKKYVYPIPPDEMRLNNVPQNPR